MRTFNEKDLAINGGPKAADKFDPKSGRKIGAEEFLSLAGRFGYAPATLEKIREAISGPDAGGGAFMGRYGADPKLAKGPAFERLACEKFGVKFAMGVNTGTSALHSAFVAVGAGPGTEVICPAIGFLATAAAVRTSGATPVFCDVDESLMIDPSRIEACISPRTVAVAPTHWGGGICDMDPILQVARKHGLKVVEDCAQAPGGKYKDRYVGSMGDVGCFSISCYKIIGCGEGGMFVTSDERLYERAAQLAECGGFWRPDRFAPERHEGELFFGCDYRMSELEAAVDLVQLGKLDEVVGRYHTAWRSIIDRLKTYREITPQKINDVDGFVGYNLRFYPESFELGGRIVAALNAEGVGAGMSGENMAPDWHLYSDMYPVINRITPFGPEPPLDEKELARLHYRRDDCPVADDLYRRNIALWLDEWLTRADCEKIASAINKVLDVYCTEDPDAAPWIT